MHAAFRLALLSSIHPHNRPLKHTNTTPSSPTPTHPRTHNPQSVAHLNIAHTKLNSLAGLSGLRVINGDLIAWDNANLTTLQVGLFNQHFSLGAWGVDTAAYSTTQYTQQRYIVSLRGITPASASFQASCSAHEARRAPRRAVLHCLAPPPPPPCYSLPRTQGLGPVPQLYGKLWMDTNPVLQDMSGLEVRRRSRGNGGRGFCVC